MTYEKKFKISFRSLLPLIISGVIGSIITIISLPAQKEIDLYYWKKQNAEVIKQNKIEKRLELLNELVVEFTRYDWCSIRAGVVEQTQIIEENPIVCYHDSSTKLLGLTFQIKYYFDTEISEQFNKIAQQIVSYEKDVDKGNPISQSGKDLRSTFSKTVIMMQDRLLENLENE